MKIRLSARAERQAETLARHYLRLGRASAIRNLRLSLADAQAALREGRSQELLAPRPYPALAKTGVAWVHSGRYWISFRKETGGLLITGIYFDGANIPARIKPEEF